MSGIAILMLIVGVLLFLISFVLTLRNWLKLPPGLVPLAELPDSRAWMWLIGLVLIIASFLI